MAQPPAYAYQAPPAGQEYAYAPQAYPPQAPGQVQPAGAPPAYAPAPAPAYAYAPHPAHPQPVYAAPPPYSAAPAHPDEVRTVFVTGFPMDVKERELNNLLRFVPGYEAAQLTWKGQYAQGFCLFHSGAAAFAAVNMLNNLVFDDKAVLRCEIARKNMYLKGEEPGLKRPRMAAPPPYTPGGYPAGGPGAPAPAGPVGYQQVSNTKDNPPCSTLFVGNLGDGVSEAELTGLFAAQPGFVTCKVVRTARAATGFVEFADLASAMAVHDSQQGAVLQSSDRGGIRIQYSKNPFGKKRDHQGNPVDPTTLPPSSGHPPLGQPGLAPGPVVPAGVPPPQH